MRSRTDTIPTEAHETGRTRHETWQGPVWWINKDRKSQISENSPKRTSWIRLHSLKFLDEAVEKSAIFLDLDFNKKKKRKGKKKAENLFLPVCQTTSAKYLNKINSHAAFTGNNCYWHWSNVALKLSRAQNNHLGPSRLSVSQQQKNRNGWQGLNKTST